MEESKPPESLPPASEPPRRRRFPRLWRRRRSKDDALQVEGVTGEEPVPLKPPKQRPWIWRARWRRWLARILAWGSVAAVGLCLLVYAGIRAFIRPDVIKNFLIEQVEEQTGGHLEVGTVKFDVMTGIRLQDVRFFPPLAGDTRGSRHGGEIDMVPLANFDALDVRYSVAKFLAGRVHIKALQLVRPQFHLRQEDGVFNFQSILAYRAVHFPPDAVKPEEKKDDKAAAGSGLLPFSPALIYMPFELLTQNVGIKELELDLVTIEKGKVTQALVTNGLTFDMGVHWFGRDSSIWFNMLSPFERPLELTVEQPVEGHFQPVLVVRSALSLAFAIDDLQKISADVAMRLMTLNTPLAGYQDLGMFVKLRMAVTDDYKGINFETLEADLADAIHYELTGLISVNDATLSEVTLRLKQKFNLDLKSAALLAKPFMPTLKADGHISSDEFRIDGTIEPDKMAAIATTGAGLPEVSGAVWLEDVFVDLPSTGVTMEPISGAVSIAAGPALSGEGSQVDISSDVTIPKIMAKQQVPTVGAVEAGVENLTSKVTARVLWPQLLAPIFKVNVEADHVLAKGDHIAPLDAPLFVDIDAEGGKDLARLGLSANVELTDLAEFTAMADCQDKCERFRSSMLGRMDRLDRIHAIALPLGALLGLTDFMPTKLTGSADFEFAARGKLPDPLTTPVPELLKQADVKFNMQMSLSKLFAKVPFDTVDLKNFETRVLASGTLAEQKIELSQKFDSVTAVVPMGADKPPLPVGVERYSLETSVDNTIEGPLDLKTVMKQLVTAIETKLYLGKVSADGVLPRPVSEIQLGFSGQQAHMTDIKVKDISVRLPDYGTSVDVAADTVIGPDFMPKKLKTTVKTQVIHTGEEKLPAGIKTSGRIDVNLSVDTPDLKTISVAGDANFDRFNVTIPGKDDKSPPQLVVEEIRGSFPFTQSLKFDLTQFTKPSAPSPPTQGGPAPTVQGGPAPTVQGGPGGNALVAEGKNSTVKIGTTAPTSPPSPFIAPPAPADVPTVEVTDNPDNEAKATNADLNHAMGQYFAKNDDQLPEGTNVVALVDYGTIRPFYPDRHPLSIKRVEAANLELDNMEFDVELRQNWFALNQFVIGFLGGKIQGAFQLAFDPTATNPKNIPRDLRVSVHMTRLDTRKLLERFPNLKGKNDSWDLFSNPFIDGTVHVVYDLKANDISGGIEITSIGKEQLKMMLYYVDPFEQNPQIAKMRSALAFGEVRQVSIPLKNGEVGMSMDVRIPLGVPIPTPKLEHFPISTIIQNYKDQFDMGGGTPGGSPAGTPPPAPGATPVAPPVKQQASTG